MINSLTNSTNFRLLMPEVIWLEPKHIERATAIRERTNNESQQWQVYLNTLALLGLEEWLRERMHDSNIIRESNINQSGSYLKIGDFKICVIATENLLDEIVNLPQDVLEQSELVAHFYAILEVLEEEEQVIIRGFQRYDLLNNYRLQVNLSVQADGCYPFPLSVFDAEPNHLLGYCCHLEPSAITLPVQEKALDVFQEMRTKLSRWLQGIVDEGWQTLDVLINSEANLALATRSMFLGTGTKAGKLINLGMQLGSQTVAMLITVTQETEEKIGINIQLYPTEGESYLPPDLTLTLLSKAGKILQEVRSRPLDSYIQLKSFKGEPGKRFSIEISLGDASVKEEFEL
ncbi:DUF1822 family protein [Chroococcus sp. FPU101]|uniref:DUF1822 family protein n=1 Tax=Chroococcus sp. FPU101 TaxID=1974212 RepID=UPI001A8D68DE|nr:DUF1822 family protein [Chroococcus sp. FPU101]GFE71065.1 unknown protein [Chroococcus sp. FPU101]